MELLRLPGREAAAAPTAAAICQEPHRSALAVANRAPPAAPAGPSWAGKAGRAEPSSFRTRGALRGAMRARCPAAELWGLHSGTSRRRCCRGQIGSSHSARGRRGSRSSSPGAVKGPDGPTTAAWNRLLPPTQPVPGSPMWRWLQYWTSGLA
eukprot:scaffold778_cov122-Isochrysis_galbana.AAC.6